MGKGKQKPVSTDSSLSPTPDEHPPASNEMVIPEVVPPPDRPGRFTNQLNFIRLSVLNAIHKMPESADFKQPVNHLKLGIVNYYKIIKRPMDLGTIRKRITNKYYYSSSECLSDFQQMFVNAYFYNAPGTGPALNARAVELTFIRKLLEMETLMEEEVEVDSLVKTTLQDSAPSNDDTDEGATGSDASRPASSLSLRPRRPSGQSSSSYSMNEVSGSSSSSGSDASGDEGQGGHSEEVKEVISKKRLNKWKDNQIKTLKEQMKMMKEQMDNLVNIDITVRKLKKKARKSRKRKSVKGSTPSPVRVSVPKKKCMEESAKKFVLNIDMKASIKSVDTSETKDDNASSSTMTSVATTSDQPIEKKDDNIGSTNLSPIVATTSGQPIEKKNDKDVGSTNLTPIVATTSGQPIEKKNEKYVGSTKTTPIVATTSQPTVAKARPRTKPDTSKPMTAEELKQLKLDIGELGGDDYEEIVSSMSYHYSSDLDDEEEELPIEKLPIHCQWEIRETVTEKLDNTAKIGETRKLPTPIMSPAGSLSLSESDSSTASPSGSLRLGLSLSPSPPPGEPVFSPVNSSEEFVSSPHDANEDEDEDEDPVMDLY